MSFTPVLRFIALSDVHYKDTHSVERERMEQALRIANRIADESPVYKGLDALCVVGDFATSGTDTQFAAFKKTLDKGLRPGTKAILSVATHEFSSGGPVGAYARLRRFFGQAADVHEVINGYHFISVSPSRGTSFKEEKQAWVAEQMALAAADAPQRPIFFFQHPHFSGTVYGSINWGDDDLLRILMNYPQTITFSGHSHAPVNDPRSVHQEHFTSFGTGTLSYFENDEFDKYYGTHPPDPYCRQAAQMLIVEADAAGRVRVTPYDILTDQVFPYVREIETPWEPASFMYTNAKRRAAALPPYFAPEASLHVERNTLTFDQAVAPQDYVNDYLVRVRRNGVIVKQLALWSHYYVIPMPETLSVPLEGLLPGEDYAVEITARGFWDNKSKNRLIGTFTAE